MKHHAIHVLSECQVKTKTDISSYCRLVARLRMHRSYINSQKTAAYSQVANYIIPHGGKNHSGQVNDLSMASTYAFDHRGKLKRLDITQWCRKNEQILILQTFQAEQEDQIPKCY